MLAAVACPLLLRRNVLQKLLQGGMLQADPEAMREWQEIQRQFQPPENFRMKVVGEGRGGWAVRLAGGRGGAGRVGGWVGGGMNLFLRPAACTSL